MNITAALEQAIPCKELELLRRLGAMAAERGEKLCLVGGAVRDAILGAPGPDIDLILEGDVRRFAEETAVALGLDCIRHDAFGTATLSSANGLRVDVAGARSETYSQPGALPHVTPDTIDADLRRRDFTVNAMAASMLPLGFGELLDPFNGACDIEHMLLRVLHANSFIDDPTRILRGFRFSDRFGFEEGTEKLVRDALKKRVFDTVSGVRIKKELRLIFEARSRGRILETCREFGVGGAIQEGFEFKTGLFYPDDRVAEAWEALYETGRASEYWAAGLAAAAAGAKPETLRALAERLGFTNAETEAMMLTNEASDPMYLEILGNTCARQSQIAELLENIPPEALVYLYAAGGEMVRVNITIYMRVVRHIRLTISGDDLIARGYKPSRRFSEALSEILRRKRDGFLTGAGEELRLAELLLKKEE